MATGVRVPDRIPGGVKFADSVHINCQPCLEDGEVRQVIGMCIDCGEHLCKACFKCHKVPKPSRHHQLIDREQMIQGHTYASTKDTCTEKCLDHDDNIIDYYCLKHCRLGCTVCITLDHKTCDDVQYIPLVAKDLANNKEFRQTEMRLKTAIDTLKTVSGKIDKNSAELETSCLEALNDIRNFRRKINEAANKIEAELIQKLQDMKSKEISDMSTLGDKYQSTLEELNSSLTKISSFQNAKQHCSTYIEMMRTKDKLVALESEIKEAELDASFLKRHIRFIPDKKLLDTIKQADTFGVLLGSSRSNIGTKHMGKIAQAEHTQDIIVKARSDKSTCCITGITGLLDGRLVLADSSNANIKVVSEQSGQLLAAMNLSSGPWDVTAISRNMVAVTMPKKKKIIMVSVGDNTMNFARSIKVGGKCYGIDYRNDKLAVSYRNPPKVNVISMQTGVINDISFARLKDPYYLTFGPDDATLYLSNFISNNIVRVKLDGTVVATYTDSELQYPEQPVVDDNGEVLVCAQGSHTVHQITNDCKKVRVLLSKAGGLLNPRGICLNGKKDKMYVGMESSDVVKVYTIERTAR